MFDPFIISFTPLAASFKSSALYSLLSSLKSFLSSSVIGSPALSTIAKADVETASQFFITPSADLMNWSIIASLFAFNVYVLPSTLKSISCLRSLVARSINLIRSVLNSSELKYCAAFGERPFSSSAIEI